MAMPLFVVKIIKKAFPYRKTIAKLTGYPAVGKILEKALFEGDELLFIPRQQVYVGETIESTQSQVFLPYRAAEYFVEKAGFRWIMDKCICRDSMRCEKYPVELGCLFLGEAAKRINPKLGRPASKEEALEHLKKCRDAGLVHLIGKNKLDSVWLNVRPGEKLFTICNCCECCCLWRILPDVSPNISSKLKRMTGVEVTVGDECSGCGTCLEVCISRAISLQSGKAVISEQCRGCGRCAVICPESAIRVSVDFDIALKSTVEKLSSVVRLE